MSVFTFLANAPPPKPLNNTNSLISAHNTYRLFNVLCWLWNIHEGAELPSVYFITSTKHCITYLALTQLLPVLVSHPEMDTLCSILLHFVWESLISSLARDAFTWDKWILLAAFLLHFFSKLSGKHFIDHTLQMYRLISLHCLCILP